MTPIAHELALLIGRHAVIGEREELLTYECDGSTMHRFPPDAVVLPSTRDQLVEVVKFLHQRRVPFIARGAGTGLSGGTLAVHGGVIIGTTRLTRIITIDPITRTATVEPGVVNTAISKAAAPHGLHFAPDPSSQHACTVGGNVAENAGGPHCLKYGSTAHHILGLELVLPNGDIINLGGTSPARFGSDLISAVVGSEGTFGIVTRVTVKLTPNARDVRTLLAVFNTVDDATTTVSRTIASGIVPAALEMIDGTVLQALEDAFQYGFPIDAAALLIIEVDGLGPSLDRQARMIAEICNANNAREVRIGSDAANRDALWRARKKAFAALGRVTPSYYTQDGVIPRRKLPQVLRAIAEIGKKHNLRIANIFHAGDGNLHPCLLFDERDTDQRKRVLAASRDILELCVAEGGSITGEHGVGIEKLEEIGLMFTPDDLAAMRQLRGVFDSDGLCNPGKVLPDGRGCWEVDVVNRRVAL
jgi:glycolate oxidase